MEPTVDSMKLAFALGKQRGLSRETHASNGQKFMMGGPGFYSLFSLEIPRQLLPVHVGQASL